MKTRTFAGMVLGTALLMLPLAGRAASNDDLFQKYRRQGIEEVKANNLDAASLSFSKALEYNPNDADCAQALELSIRAIEERDAKTPGLGKRKKASVLKNHHVRITGGVEYYQWKEYIDGDEILTESGPLFALEINGDYTHNQKIWFRYRAKVFGGEVDYDGALQELDPDTQTISYTPYESTTEYIGLELQLEGDLFTLVSSDAGDALNLFLGLGYRGWERDLVGEYGYREGWSTLYVATGLWGRYLLSASGKSQLTGRMELRLPIYNHEEVYIVDYPDLQPGWAPSFYGSVGLDAAYFSLEAYVQALYFSESDAEAVPAAGLYILQPESFGLMAGIKLGIVF